MLLANSLASNNLIHTGCNIIPSLLLLFFSLPAFDLSVVLLPFRTTIFNAKRVHNTAKQLAERWWPHPTAVCLPCSTPFYCQSMFCRKINSQLTETPCSMRAKGRLSACCPFDHHQTPECININKQIHQQQPVVIERKTSNYLFYSVLI